MSSHLPPGSRAWILPIALLILSWTASSVIGYFHNDIAVTNRVTVVETQERMNSDRLDRIENKLDRLFYEMTGHKP